jgi:hypothetical protein
MKPTLGKVLPLFCIIAFSVACLSQEFSAVPDGEFDPGKLEIDPAMCPAAVSEINGKINYSGGNMNSDEGHNFDGSITFPIMRHLGFQADALYSRIGGEDFYGGAGHLFARDPDLGLIGFTGGYLDRKGVNTYQFGAEAEWYLNRFTLGAFAGVGKISYDNAAPFIDTDPTRFIGRISADYYLTDDLRVGASYTTAFHDNLYKGQAEYQTPMRGVALTVEVAGGDHGYDHWLVGVTYYFGGNKSLRDRQRRDDPPSMMPQVLHGLGVYGAEFNRKGNEYLAANPGSGSLGSGNGSFGLVMTRVDRSTPREHKGIIRVPNQ